MIRIPNWSSFQSYKDRKPPWIRLHKTLLDNFEFQSMSADARAILPMIWLLASEDEDPLSGHIKCDYKKISFRLRLSVEIVIKALDEMREAGFVELNQPCIESVHKSLHTDEQSVTPERERETEAYKKEKEKEGEKEVGIVPVKPSRPAAQKMSDEEWLLSLKTNPAYRDIEIDREYGKMLAWCQNKKKVPSRARFLNWLNRVDVPMKADTVLMTASKGAMGGLARAAALRQQQQAEAAHEIQS